MKNFGSYRLNFSSEDMNVFYVKNNDTADAQNRRPTDRYVRHHLENLPRRLCDRLAVEKQQGLNSQWSLDSGFEMHDADFELKEQSFRHVGCTSNKSVNFYAVDSQSHWMFYDVLGMKHLASGGAPTAVLFDKAVSVIPILVLYWFNHIVIIFTIY